MTLLKDNNYKEINVALLSLEADIKNKITNIDTSVIDRQLAEINSRIDKINAGGNNPSAAINDIRTEIEDINHKLNVNSAKIENIEQKLADIFTAENKVTDFNTTTGSGVYYWVDDAANRPSDYGVLLVNKYDGGSDSIWINQVAYGTNNKIYFRQNINSGNWTEWKAVAFDGEINADTVDNYHASQLWRSDGATWNPNANVTMTPSGNDSEWSFDFRNKNGATGTFWRVWDENKQTLLKVDADSGKVSAPYGFVGNLSGKADSATKLEDASTKVPYISKRTGDKKILVKVGSFPDGAEVSFLLTIKRTDGKGFTGFLTLNSHSVFGNYNGLNGIKSDYDMHEIRGGELVFLYRNSDNSTDVYMNIPSYASMYMLIFMPKSYSDIELKEVSGFSGTLLDKF